MKLLLASESPRRQDILHQIGVKDFMVCPADIDETPMMGETGRTYAIRMAQNKAMAFDLEDDTGILSADTVVCTSRKILPKALDKDTATSCIEYLSGRRHTVYTAMCFRTPQHTHTAVVKTTVQFKHMDISEIRDYITHGDWQGKAGGYAIQGLASRYIRYIGGSHSAVVGLDTHTVYKWLYAYGII